MNWSILPRLIQRDTLKWTLMAVLGYLSVVDAVRHGQNLIWAMNSAPFSQGRARIVAIEADPADWLIHKNISVRHITAPHDSWMFGGVAFHFRQKAVVWTERSKQRVQALSLDGSQSAVTLYPGTSSSAVGVTVDWVSNNVYFSDAMYNWILMTPLTNVTSEDPVYKMVVRTGLEHPYGLAVHPLKGYLIWSDFGVTSQIEMSDLLGQGRRPLVQDDILKPVGVAIDFTEDRLYWVDVIKRTIERVDLQGNNRKTIVQAEGVDFFGVASFGDFVFVTEQAKGQLQAYSKVDGKRLASYSLNNVPFGITFYDESQQPAKETDCDSLGCHHFCIDNPPDGAMCYCGEGFELNADNITCNETQRFIQPSHIYAIGDAICQYPGNFPHMSLTNVTLDTQCYLKTGKGYTALTYDARNRMLFFAANRTNSIGRVKLEKGSFTNTLMKGIGEVKGMALDWTSGTLFWTDAKYKKVMAANTEKWAQTTVIDGDLQQPIGIAVHPQRGTIYWADADKAVIETAMMNGRDRRPLPLFDGVQRPSHLQINFDQDVLYWSDPEACHVGAFDLNTEVSSIFHSVQNVHFYGLSVYQDFLIWTSYGDMNGIHAAYLDTMEKVRGILHPAVGVASDLVTYDIHNQPDFKSPCSSACDQICLPYSNESYTCACGIGFTLSDDLRTCVSNPINDNFLLVTDGYQGQIYQVAMDAGDVQAVPLSSDNRPVAIAFEPEGTSFYWSDNSAHVIKQAFMTGGSDTTVVYLDEDAEVDGLAVDHINRLLYYTDSGNDVIMAINIRWPDRRTVVIGEELDRPRDIVLHPLEGRMYWTDWGSSPRIETSNMAGGDREVLVNLTQSSWPNGLSIDYAERKLYWIDAKHNRIEVIDLDGSNRKLILQETEAHYFGMALAKNYLYITDWKRNYVSRLDKTGQGQIEPVGPASFPRLNGIASFRRDELLEGQRVCFSKTCEYMCLPLPESTYTCICPSGYEVFEKTKCKEITNDTIITTETPDSRGKPDSLPVQEKVVSGGLSTGAIVAIALAAATVMFGTVFVGFLLYKRQKQMQLPHERLMDETNQVESFYRITFPENQHEEPSISGREEQPLGHNRFTS